MQLLLSFVSMCALLFVVYFQVNHINADWCSNEIDILRLNSEAIINHFNIERED
jgi:hypothetical protein